MSEEQIVDITVTKEDLSHFDTGGATRRVTAVITVDSSLPIERQRVGLIHEILGAYLGTVISTSDIAELALSIADGLNQLESDIEKELEQWEVNQVEEQNGLKSKQL